MTERRSRKEKYRETLPGSPYKERYYTGNVTHGYNPEYKKSSVVNAIRPVEDWTAV
jgi:hypothetical protein